MNWHSALVLVVVVVVLVALVVALVVVLVVVFVLVVLPTAVGWSLCRHPSCPAAAASTLVS